jgi:hypothetical protein
MTQCRAVLRMRHRYSQVISPNIYICVCVCVCPLTCCILKFSNNRFWYVNLSPKERDPDNNQTPQHSYYIALDWTGIQHTHTPTEHSQQLALTQTLLSLQQTQTLHRAFKIEFHNSELHKKSPPTQASNLPEHQTKAWDLSVHYHTLLQKQSTQNLLISLTPPKTVVFYNFIPYLIRFFSNAGASFLLVTNAAEENQ